MRRTQRQQAEQGIQLLEQAHKEIREQIERQKTETAEKLLEQCQQYAIALGQMIEKEEGEGTAAVRLLEEYCEQVYQIYQEAGQLQPKDAKHAYRKLGQAVPRLKDSIRELPVRTEAVFLPYKASMWDSLESIWMAACEDPACDAYVIPIPYYDKHPDGSLGELHDESGLYPGYVPITDYREYSFAERRPDLIFIHNPYDAYNYLTSVHPFFYAENLKKFTEKLVYVPYFVLEELDPDNPAQVEGISHFCTTSGVLYADKVIVQSEKMRQVYVRVMTEFTKGHGMTRKYWEEKILGLGSPKLDRVRTAQKEAWELPEEWRKIIQKPDGSRKKVILYNTGLTAFLQHSSIYLDKVRDVFRIFREKREEAVLLWRPHPLLHATAKTMRPEVLEDYEQLLQEYLADGFGIYDDSADLNRAIAVCDAYYGDPSSVVQLCREAGKPVMLQNIEMLLSEQQGELLEQALIPEQAYDDGNSFWFMARDYNALFRVKKENSKIELIGMVPGERFMQKRLYPSAASCNGKLYFAPHSAKEVAEYDLQKRVFKKLSIPSPHKIHDLVWSPAKFFGIEVIGNKIYFIPDRYPGILCYDPQTQSFSCFDEWVDEIEKLRTFDGGYFMGYVRTKNQLVIPCICADAVVIFDADSGTSHVIKTSDTNKKFKYAGIIQAEDSFYLITAGGAVLKRKLESENEEVKRILMPNPETDQVEFYPIQYADGHLYLFPLEGNKGVKINVKTDQATWEPLLDEEEKAVFSLLPSRYMNEKIYTVSRNGRYLMGYDFINQFRQELSLFVSVSDQTFLKKQKREEYRRLIGAECILENEAYTLSYMLETEQTDRGVENSNTFSGECRIGNRIYHCLMGNRVHYE